MQIAVERIVATFRRELSGWVEALEEAPPAAHDLAEIHRIAHSIKGGASLLGIDPLAEASRELEALADQGKGADSAGFEALVAAFDRTLAAAKAFLATQGSTPEEAPPTAPRSATSHRLLVVDDVATARLVKRRVLLGSGYEVEVARDGAEAWRMLQSESFDLLVSDVEMPELDGVALTQKLRASTDPRLAGLPVILVTGRDAPEDRQRGFDAGASDYLSTERFDASKLLDAVARLLG